MRKFALLAGCLALIAPLGPARAQMQTQGITVGSPPPQTRPARPPHTLAGTIAAIDTRDRSFTCRWNGRSWVFETTDHTSFRLGRAPASFAVLKIGDRVSVRYRTVARRFVAQTVSIAP